MAEKASVEPIFVQGQGVVVSATGPGKIHVLTYDPLPSISNLHPTVGFIQIPAKSQSTITRLMISHSHGFRKYGFYWEGNGKAVATAGPVKRVPVGESWGEATCVDFGDDNFITKDISTKAASAKETDAITCFVIPELT